MVPASNPKIQVKGFWSAVRSVSQLLEQRNLQPSQFWYLESNGSSLRMHLTLAESEFQTILLASGDDFKALVSARSLAGIAETSDSDNLVISLATNYLQIEGDGAIFRLALTKSLTQLPVSFDVPPAVCIPLPERPFREAVAAASAVDYEGFGYSMIPASIVCVDLYRASVSVTASNVVSISHSVCSIEATASGFLGRAIVSADSLKVAIHFVARTSGEVFLSSAEGSLVLCGSESVCRLRGFALELPAADIIFRDDDVIRGVPVDALLNAIDRVSALSIHDPRIDFFVSDTDFVVRGGEDALGSASSRIVIPRVVDFAVKFRLRRSVVREWLKILKSGQVVISWSDSGAVRLECTSTRGVRHSLILAQLRER